MLSLIGAITIGVGTVYGYYRHKNNQSAINIQENAEDLAKTVASDVANQVGKLKDKFCGKSSEPSWSEAENLAAKNYSCSSYRKSVAAAVK